MENSEDKPKVVTSMVQLANVTGISIKTLEAAKFLGCQWFESSGRKNVLQITKWIEEHQDEIDSFDDLSIADVNKANKLLDGEIKKLEIAKLKRNQIDPVEVKQWTSGLGVLLSAEINKAHSELRAKCGGFETVIDKRFKEIFEVIKTEVKKYGTIN